LLRNQSESSGTRLKTPLVNCTFHVPPAEIKYMSDEQEEYSSDAPDSIFAGTSDDSADDDRSVRAKRKNFDSDHDGLEREDHKVARTSSPPPVRSMVHVSPSYNQTSCSPGPSSSDSDVDDYTRVDNPLDVPLPESDSEMEEEEEPLPITEFFTPASSIKSASTSLADTRDEFSPRSHPVKFAEKCASMWRDMTQTENNRYMCTKLEGALRVLRVVKENIPQEKPFTKSQVNDLLSWFHIFEAKKPDDASFCEAVFVSYFNRFYTLVTEQPANTVWSPFRERDGTISMIQMTEAAFRAKWKHIRVQIRDWEREILDRSNDRYNENKRQKKKKEMEQQSTLALPITVAKWKFLSVAELWLEHTARNEVQGIVFEPTDKEGNMRSDADINPDEHLNTWTGFKYSYRKVKKDLSKSRKKAAKLLEEEKLKIKEHLTDDEEQLLNHWYGPQKMLDHIKYVWCNAGDPNNPNKADEKVYEHVINFMASMMQFPYNKLLSMICVRGAQGIGKNCVTNCIAALMGRAFFLGLNRQADLTAHFNQHMTGKLCIVLDENQPDEKDRSENPQIKALITDKHTLMTSKGKDSYQGVNFFNAFMLSNKYKMLNVEPGARRYLMVDADNGFKWIKQKAHTINRLNRKLGYSYIPDLENQPNDTIFEVYHTYLRRGFFEPTNQGDIPDGPLLVLYGRILYEHRIPHNFTARNPPKTELFKWHVESDLPAVTAWWLQCLRRKSVFSLGDPVWDSDDNEAQNGWEKHLLYDDFNAWLQTRKLQFINDVQFWKDLRDLLGDANVFFFQRNVTKINSKRQWKTSKKQCVKFAGYYQQRANFIRQTGIDPQEDDRDEEDDEQIDILQALLDEPIPQALLDDDPVPNTTTHTHPLMYKPPPSDKQIRLDEIKAKMIALQKEQEKLQSA
jgi:hypothetical protein